MSEFDILNINQKIEWALNTIRHKELFGLDELNASVSRERRAKGVLLDCKKEIEKLQAKLAEKDKAIKDLQEELIKEKKLIAQLISKPITMG